MTDFPTETKEPEEPHGPSDGALHAPRLRAFLVAYLIVMVCFIVGTAVAALQWHSIRVALLSAILACLATSNVIGLRLVRRGRLDTAALTTAYVLLVAAPLATYITPFASLAAAVAAVVAVAVALPYVRGRRLRSVLGAALAADFAVGLAAVIAPSNDELPATLIAVLRVSTLSAASFLVLMLLWQFSSQLRHTLDDTLASNAALERARGAEVLAREHAEAAVRVRDDFLSMASHEFRTPLAGMSLQLQLAARAAGGSSAENHPEILARIARACAANERLVRLLDTLLDVSRVGSGHLELEPEEFDLVDLAREVAERFSELHPAGALTVRSDAKVSSRWDRLRMEQVVTNLVGNAIKYGAGKPIELVVKALDGVATLEVIDHGIGIPEERLQTIFDRFERAVSSREYGGFGLGLWIARQIVEAHGGSIRATSRQGEGSTFTVTLPMVR